MAYCACFASVIEQQNFFEPAEMDRLICGENSPWSVEELRDSCKADHGYTLDSPAVQVSLSRAVSPYGIVLMSSCSVCHFFAAIYNLRGRAQFAVSFPDAVISDSDGAALLPLLRDRLSAPAYWR